MKAKHDPHSQHNDPSFGKKLLQISEQTSQNQSTLTLLKAGYK